MAKRKRTPDLHRSVRKRRRLSLPEVRDGGPVHHALLHRCYHQVKTLKDYLLDAPPPSSRTRRRRVCDACSNDSELATLLNETLVGIQNPPLPPSVAGRQDELKQFTQQRRLTQFSSAGSQPATVAEIVDFVVCALFSTRQPAGSKPNHLLCYGLEHSVTGRVHNEAQCDLYLPGILQRRPNSNIRALKQPLWQQALDLAGPDGEVIFTNLLLDCGLFVAIDRANGCYHQLSGYPLHDLCLGVGSRIKQLSDGKAKTQPSEVHTSVLRTPGDICIVRSRILYSKPSLNRSGNVQFGLKHMHVLNRLSDLGSRAQDFTVMRYIFPRQFRMHNVFTSTVDRRQTVQPFKDYTFRDDELCTISDKDKARIPRRLRGEALQLVRKLRQFHARCSYSQLLAHYCPLPSATQPRTQSAPANSNVSGEPILAVDTQAPPELTAGNADNVPASNEDHETSFLPYVASTSQVSSFVVAVLRKILPPMTFGVGHAGRENWQKTLSRVDRFIRMRRFESTTVHDLVQGLKLTSIGWLRPHGPDDKSKLSKVERLKREELLNEVVYYVFDSLVIPLLASNFYVTESGVHRNRLLFFRQDVWQRLCQPSLMAARLGPLVPVNGRKARSFGDQLSYNISRLLPKDAGTRTITNLRRRLTKVANGRVFLSSSTNAKLTPIFNIFNYERQQDRGVFSIESMSIRDLHRKLVAFKSRLGAPGAKNLFFAKVDIRSAFDSIPQDELLGLIHEIFKHREYDIVRFAENKLLCSSASKDASRSSTKFLSAARPAEASKSLDWPQGRWTKAKKGVVSSEVNGHQAMTVGQAKQLLDEHIKNNVVRIGNKFYRQAVGIPQGSVLSSMLCTFFYNKFEKEKLGFLDSRSSLLLRIIDDFLLVTTNETEAVRFVGAMKSGDTSYGIVVHPEKSVVNFDMTIDGIQIPKISRTDRFPFCGLFIDTQTLEVSKDRVRKDNIVGNTLTVDRHGHAGEKLLRRITASLKIQLQSILLDGSLNSRLLIARTLAECFQETAMKMHQYIVNMPKHKRPSQNFLLRLIQQLVVLAKRTVGERQSTVGLIFTRQQICCLAAASIERVLLSRKSRYPVLLWWLRNLKAGTLHSLKIEPHMLDDLVDAASRSLQHYKY